MKICANKKSGKGKGTLPDQDVEMYMVKYHQFVQEMPRIGTQEFCGCTTVAIISPAGAIVAHITPGRMAAGEQTQSAKGTAEEMLAEVHSLYAIHQNKDLHGARAVVVVPHQGGTSTDPDLVKTIVDGVERIGFTPVTLGHYNSIYPGEEGRDVVYQGTVFVDGSNSISHGKMSMPAVYVEARLLRLV